MKNFKQISLFTALIAFVLAFSFSTSHAQVTEQQTEAFTIKGKVVNAETTEIITNAKVLIAGKDISAMTDKEGKFALNNLPQGTHTLKVEMEGYETWEKEMELNSDHELTIKLKPKPQQ